MGEGSFLAFGALGNVGFESETFFLLWLVSVVFLLLLGLSVNRLRRLEREYRERVGNLEKRLLLLEGPATGRDFEEWSLGEGQAAAGLKKKRARAARPVAADDTGLRSSPWSW